MHLRRPPILLACVLLSQLAMTAGIEAQVGAAEPDPQELHIARSLFEEGLQYVDSQDWEKASDRFSRVLQIRWSPVVAYNLGSAQLRLGRAVFASEQFRRVLREPDLEASVRTAASQLLAEAEGRMGRVRIAVKGPGEGTEVLVDGNGWPDAAMGVAVPFDPGPHRILLRRQETVIEDREITLEPGEAMDVVFDLTPAVPAPAAVAAAAGGAQGDGRPDPMAASAQAPIESELNDDDGGSRWWLWGGIGAAVVGAVVVGVLVAASGSPGEADAMPGDLETIEGKVR